MAYAQRSALGMKDVCDPKLIAVLPEDVRRMEIGGIIGVATGLVEHTDPKTQEVSFGLKGRFRTVPEHIDGIPDREPCESTKLWLPDHGHKPVEELLLANKNDPNFSVEIGFKLAVLRAKNPQGYTWEIHPMGADAKSPLDDLEKKFRAAKLEHSSAKVRQLAAPTSKDKKSA